MLRRLIAFLLFVTILLTPALAEMDFSTPEVAEENFRLLEPQAAASAAHIYAEPSSEANAAWIFCATKVGVYSKGSFWFVSDAGATFLGESDKVASWGLLHSKPEVYRSETGEPQRRQAHAAVCENGAPVRLEGAEKLVNLYNLGNMLCGMYEWQNYDYCILSVNGGRLFEVVPQEVGAENLEKLPRFAEIADCLAAFSDYFGQSQFISFLYYAPSLLTVSFTTNSGAVYHGYIFKRDGEVVYEKGWEGEPAALEGLAAPGSKTDLPLCYTGSDLREGKLIYG